MPSAIGHHWLLLRGLTREAGHWGEFITLLQSRFPDSRISTLDLPGTGQRHTEASPCHIAEIIETLRHQALSRRLLQQPLSLIGLSLGGMVTWEWMLRYPEDVGGAVLINTSLADASPFYHRLRWQAYPSLFKLLFQANDFRRESAVIRCVANRRDLAPQIATEWADIQAKRPVTLNNTLRQIKAAASYRPGDVKPEPPILLLTSRNDRLVSPACSDAIQRKWHLTQLNHPWGGHDLTLDDGPWVADRLGEWVERLRSETKAI
ncbi:MAG: alpha/beta hydrolase [Methylomonas sp.]|nr:alpha/beta hydrolase [Methylomonas sp.]